MNQVKFGISQSVLRKEDDPLLRGRGRYVVRSYAGRTRCTPSCCARRMPMREFRITDVTQGARPYRAFV